MIMNSSTNQIDQKQYNIGSRPVAPSPLINTTENAKMIRRSRNIAGITSVMVNERLTNSS